MGILEGKNILVAGVTLDTSIAFHVARIAQAEGATVLVSNFGRAMSLTNRVIKKLDPVPPLLEVDVTNYEHLAGLAAAVGEHVDRLDGLVHSLAFANPETALGGKFLSHAVERRRHRAPGLRLLARLVDHGLPAAVRRLGLGGGTDLRRDRLLAGLRLDGGGEVGAGEHQPLPGPLPRARGRTGQPGRRRPAGDAGQEGDRRGRTSSTRSGRSARRSAGNPRTWSRRRGRWSRCSATGSPRTTGEMVHVDGGVHAMGA